MIAIIGFEHFAEKGRVMSSYQKQKDLRARVVTAHLRAGQANQDFTEALLDTWETRPQLEYVERLVGHWEDLIETVFELGQEVLRAELGGVPEKDLSNVLLLEGDVVFGDGDE